MTKRSNLTLDEILTVWDNRPAFDALVSSLRDGEAIAFVGAGASAGMYPLWGEFIGLLADHAVAEGKAGPKDAARWKADTTSTPQQRVGVILRRLGERRYRSFLKETFAPRRRADGRRYTDTHAALLRLPFRGYVTTNYDPALDFARMDLRPDSLTTGTPTWQDDEEVHRWYTGDVFRREEDCPVLWLHGYWQRPQGIVLNSGEYSAAYRPGLYRRLFDALWGQRRLAFVGFGFNDPQFTFMVNEYLRDLENANAMPRHVAVLGLPVGDDGVPPDDEAVGEWRDNLEEDYHVRPLFYPVRGGDHSALRVLLDAVADALVLRGRALMLEGRADCAGRAMDDAEEALRLARECGYAWAERDALFLKAEAHGALAAAQQGAGNAAASEREREAARRARAEAEAIAARLVLTEEDLAAAEAKAVAWLKEWEKEEKGKEKKR
jgi:hypothetical protein